MVYNNKITIITVCYNAQYDLEMTINSVISQTFKDIEYIIIDGGSNDGSLDVICKYKECISKWISEPDNGIYDAMNKGIGLATGKWINFMNAGDTFVNSKVLESIFNIDYPDEVRFLYSDNYYKDKKGKLKIGHNDHLIPSILHQSAIYKTELHRQYGLYAVTPQIIVSDFLFFCQLPSCCFKKVDTIISVNTIDGISSAALWCGTQRLCAMVVFRKLSFTNMLIRYIAFRLKRFLLVLFSC